MPRSEHAIDHAFSQADYERVLELSAAIADEDKSVECFFHHLMPGYGWMGPGTLSHHCSRWYDPGRKGIQAPSFEDCDCGDCREHAKRIADRNSENGTYKHNSYENYDTNVREPYLNGAAKFGIYDSVFPAVGEGWER